MSRSLAETQRTFAAALIDAAVAPPDSLCAASGGPVGRRFAIYRNNGTVSLIEALRARFPITERLVGDEFFRAMARLYAAERRPTSPVMLTYGHDFPAFIAGFAPAGELPYLSDVARFEVAWSDAYHAAEAVPLGIEALHGVPAEHLAAAHLQLHPSLRLVASSHPVVSLWAAHQREDDVEPVKIWEPEDALIVRPDAEVLVHRLPPGGHAFLAGLANGCALGDAVEAAASDAAGFDVAANLGAMFAAGAVIGVQGAIASEHGR